MGSAFSTPWKMEARTAAVGGDGVKGCGEQRVIVEEAVTGADDRLAISRRVPCQTEAWSDVFVVAGNALDNAESLFGGGVDRSGRGEQRADFDIISDTVVYDELAGQLPAVLREEAHGNVVKRLVRVPNTLNVSDGDPQAIGLQAIGAGQRRAEGREAAEVDVAAEIELEDLRFRGAQLDEVVVAAEFEGVLAANEADLVGEFGAALDAIDGGVRLAAEIGDARNVDADVAAAGKLRESEVQAAAGVLEAGFVEIAIADNGVVLESDVEVAGLRQASAGAGVLPEDLVLRSGRLAGDERRRNANAKERIVAIAPTLIQAAGPETGFFGDRVVSADGVDSHVGSGEWRQARAVGEANDAIDLLTDGARDGDREKLRAER